MLSNVESRGRIHNGLSPIFSAPRESPRDMFQRTSNGPGLGKHPAQLEAQILKRVEVRRGLRVFAI